MNELAPSTEEPLSAEMNELAPSTEEPLSVEINELALSTEEPLSATVVINDRNIFPDEWTQQNEDIELKLLVRGSTEWLNVYEIFCTTLPSKHIIMIQRIQSKRLWENYHNHRERMKTKNGEDKINEMLLFHGTRNTPPDTIYHDEEGIDMRCSRTGMWGMGNYFAVNASYSDDYAHHLSDGTRQMILAKVLTGHSITLEPDNTLRKPPVKESSVQGIVRYDTVTGCTNGSQVYIAYHNDKAYPFYLISYK